ncbi:MAG: hypothetical protein PHC53_00325 [Patescibacteria group bacterium]|nr:hypothetical protein [Patescibacteria group bacterium]
MKPQKKNDNIVIGLGSFVGVISGITAQLTWHYSNPLSDWYMIGTLPTFPVDFLSILLSYFNLCNWICPAIHRLDLYFPLVIVTDGVLGGLIFLGLYRFLKSIWLEISES